MSVRYILRIPVSNTTCQFCDKPGKQWHGPSHQYAQTIYYRCEQCGHVWTDRELGSEVSSEVPDAERGPISRLFSFLRGTRSQGPRGSIDQD